MAWGRVSDGIDDGGVGLDDDGDDGGVGLDDDRFQQASSAQAATGRQLEGGSVASGQVGDGFALLPSGLGLCGTITM